MMIFFRLSLDDLQSKSTASIHWASPACQALTSAWAVCLQTRPQEAAFVLSLLHPDPASRPTVDSIVHSQLLLALHKSVRSRRRAGECPPTTGGYVICFGQCSSCTPGSQNDMSFAKLCQQSVEFLLLVDVHTTV